jgi:GTP-binding protein HflX
VNAVLAEIGAGGKPTLMVFNKMDRLNEYADGIGAGGVGTLNRLKERHQNAVTISATTGEGIASLLAEIGTQLRPKREFLELRVPHEQAAVIARLHKVGQVISRSYRGPAARFKARIPPQYHDEFAPYIVTNAE